MQLVMPRDFAGQFVIAKRASDLPDGPRFETASLYLTVFDPLPTVRVEDSEGRSLGLLLGLPIDTRGGRLIDDRLRLPEPLGVDIDTFVETHIYGLSGSFIFVLDVPGARRIYLDACGSLSAVYDPERECVAATSLQLLSPGESRARFRAAMHERLCILRDGWFPAGLTAHEGIFRLMPNHYLELDTFEVRRHWPMAPISPTPDPVAACATILNSMRRQMQIVAEREPVYVSLTAGNETRMLVAAAKPFHQKLDFVTIQAKGAELDRVRAEELVARFCLQHRLIPLRHGSVDEGWEWHARTGYTFGGPHMQTHRTTHALRDRRILIGGLGGEIGRGFFWRPEDNDDTALDVQGLWARMGMPLDQEALPPVETWLAGVAGLPTLLRLDLAYMELRMGCWGFAPSYASVLPLRLHPLISRENFTAMLSLPPEWRRRHNRTNRMIREVIAAGWPELLDLPISRYGDYRDPLSVLSRALTKPHLVAKKIRKLFG